MSSLYTQVIDNGFFVMFSLTAQLMFIIMYYAIRMRIHTKKSRLRIQYTLANPNGKSQKTFLI